jgi:hypothetical protein
MKIYQLAFLLTSIAANGVIISDQSDTVADSGSQSTAESNSNNLGSFNRGPTIAMQDKAGGGAGSVFNPWF